MGIMLRNIAIILLVTCAASSAAAELAVPRGVVESALKTSDCAASYEQATEHLDPPHDLGDGQKMQEILCRKDEYQYSGIFIVYPEASPDAARVLVFSFPKIRGFESRHSLTAPEFSAKEKTLTSLNRGRKNSVCGSAGEWKWNGRDFILTRYWLKVDCNKGRFDPKRRPKEWLIYPKK
jgi:hypothetical protein